MRSNRFAQQVREPRATITSKRCGSNLETRPRQLAKGSGCRLGVYLQYDELPAEGGLL
jgi:hypothetical protein